MSVMLASLAAVMATAAVADAPCTIPDGCSEHPANGADTMSGAPRVAIGDMPRFSPAGFYDGWFWVGRVEASPPALDAPPPPQP
jgi:hypothetical protein